MSAADKDASEIKSWLKVILKNECIEDFSVNILGNSEKGDGYNGDVVFVQVTAFKKDGTETEYNLVVKSATQSKVFREETPVKEAFLNEIYLYETIFPSFMQFQKEKNVDEPFSKVPKCYGTLATGNMEVIVLENLKNKGYILWDKNKPLTRKHIDMVVKEYAKFHAVSVAMQDQQPEKFRKLADGVEDLYVKFIESMDMMTVFETTGEEVYDLLKTYVSERILLKWKNWKQHIKPFFTEITKHLKGLKVITHGDCWNNNFLHYHINDLPSTFAIIDWQLARVSIPTLDLSYFLFACLSEEDICDMEVILKQYHLFFSKHVTELGSDPDRFYSFNDFLNEWKKYCMFGVIMASLIHRPSLPEKNDIPDMVKAPHPFLAPFIITDSYKKRVSSIVKYAAENDFI